MSPESDKGNTAPAEGKDATHHMSDIDYWKHPERNYYVFIALSFLLGFFGADHFYLRSFGTGMQKGLFNIASFGLWYFWDILQIIYEGEKVKKDGLSSPFDWTRGIGRGIFAEPPKKEDEMVVRVKKDIVVYALLTVLFGVFGLDKFYMGNFTQGVAKLFSVFNIFLFLFGLAWAVWDSVHVLFFTQDLLKDGITLPPPYSFIFDTIPVKDLFVPEEVSKEDLAKEAAKEKETAGFFSGFMPKLPNVVNMETFRFLYKELAVPLLKPSVGTTIEKVQKGVEVGEKAVDVGQEVIATVPKVASAVTSQIQTIANPEKMMNQIKAAAEAKVAERVGAAGNQLKGAVDAQGAKLQDAATAAVPPSALRVGKALVGGGSDDTIGSGPIVAGTLTAIVLAGAVKVVAELLSQHQK